MLIQNCFSLSSLIFLISCVVVRVQSKSEYSPLLHSNPEKIAANWAFDHVPINAEDLEIVKDVSRSLKTSWIEQEIFQKILKKFSQNGNATCGRSLEKYARDLAEKAPYALQMLDAWGKPESGILQGNIHFMGRYYECRSSRHPEDEFTGRWFSLLIPMKSNEPSTPFPSQAVGIEFGSCFPNTCTADDITGLMADVFSNKTTTFKVTAPPEPHKVDGLDIFALTLICFLLLLVIAGTACEFIWKNQRFQSYLTNDDSASLLEESPVMEAPLFVRVMTSFSLITNVGNLMNTEKKEGNIHCLHGIRFFSMTWVLLAHTFVFTMPFIDNTLNIGKYILENPTSMVVINGTFSVDSFFFLSGLLVAYLGMRELSRSDGKINIPLMYLHRFLRLTSPYIFVMLLSVSVIRLVSTGGPHFTTVVQHLHNVCHKYWWTNLLYINNFHPSTQQEECNSYSWYLANDMQFYLLSPVFLLLLFRTPKKGISIMSLVTLCSIAITFAISYYYVIPPSPIFIAKLAHLMTGDKSIFNQTHLNGHGNSRASEADRFGSDVYTKPWCRIGVYMIGMVTGYIIYKTKGNLKLSKPVVLLGWILTIALQVSLVYGLHVASDPPFISIAVSALYMGLCRPLWAIGLAWVCIACTNGYGGLVDRFLSWEVFIPLSRLTYSCYLVHPYILYYILGSQEVLFHFSIILYAIYFIAAVVMANGIGFILSMLVEAPVASLQKVLLKKKVSIPNTRAEEDISAHPQTIYRHHSIGT